MFHSAATLKFDESLAVAMEQNVRSVMRLMDICDKLPNIDVTNLPTVVKLIYLEIRGGGRGSHDISLRGERGRKIT